VAGRYTESLDALEGVQLPLVAAESSPVWHVYAIHHRRRDELRAALGEAGVETRMYYPVPPHLSYAYRERGWKRGDFPVTEQLGATNLALPISPQLSDAESGHVVDAVRSAVARLAS
jgi:dTDP-4-amino-4,6-dideoxygalactose transaminase